MGLFGFGKKKQESESRQTREEALRLNKRSADRYWVENLPTSLGEGVDGAKNSIAVGAKMGSLSVGDLLDLQIVQERYEAEVERVATTKVAFRLSPQLRQEILRLYLKTIIDEDPKTPACLDLKDIVHDQEIEINKALVNLMLELDDPNTNIEKFKSHIEALPKLKEELLKKANSIEKARAARVEDVGAAITRLGFSEVKKEVYDFINNEVNLSNTSLPQFRNFEAYHIFLTGFFKKLAPLFGFKDIKNEGQSLLNMLIIPAVIINKQAPEAGKWYHSPKELFGLEMRFLERLTLGCDFIEISKDYFVQTLGVFRYLFDGFALGYQMLYPQYPLSIDIELSERKLKFGYLCYLSMLALRFLFANDNFSGYLLFGRLQRLGMSVDQSKAFIDELIQSTNDQLSKIGIESALRYKDIPSSQYTLSSILGSGIYVEYLAKSFSLFDKNGTRLALRYEDESFAHDILEKILNLSEYGFRKEPFCVVPCERLVDEDLYLDQFKSFDIVIFKNVDKLPKRLFKDFEKIWKDFEGKCIATYSSYSMIDFDNEVLYQLLNPFVVDFPSYHQSATLYVKMLSYTKQKIDHFFQAPVCDLTRFKEGLVSQKSVYWECIKEI